ncbi:MAG TPA: hypothetical protein VHQ70_07755 [Syntrophomonadaceae bacterium]|nr:hypothetical protein [Syntrophomonadaceae bacterium]
MFLSISNHIKKIGNFVLLILIALTCIIPLLQTGVTLRVIFIFTAWLVIFNLLPGAAIWGLTYRKINGISDITAFLTVGVSYNIICYLAGLIANAYWLYIILILLLAVTGGYFIFSRIQELKKISYRIVGKFQPDSLILAILFTAANAILYYNYYLSAPLPGLTDVEYYLDIPWHLGNIAALSFNWFPQDFRLTGYAFHYHFMAYAWMAALKDTCSFSSAMVLLRLYPAFFLNLLLLLIWYTGRILFSRRAGNWAVILFLMTGNFWPFKPHNLFLNNLMYSPTYLLAIALMLFLILEIHRYMTTSDTRTRISSMLVIIPLMAMLAGAKGPFLPVVIAGIFTLMMLVKMIRNKAALLLGCALFVFFLVYLAVYQGGGAADLGIKPGQLIYNTAIFNNSYLWLQSKGIVYNGFLAMIIYFLAYLGIKWVSVVYSIKMLQDRERQIQYSLLLGMAAAGLAGGYFIEARDNSQYYFLFAGIAALNLLTANFLAKLSKSGQDRGKHLLILSLVLTVMVPSFIDTYYMVNKNINDTAQRQKLKTKALTPGLYEGLVFLSKHTPADARVVGRRFSNTAGRRVWFYYSAFSERRILLEGWEFMPSNRTVEVEKRYRDIARLYKTRSSSEAREILSRYRIDYLIADKKYYSTCPHFPRQGIITPIFANQKVIIYKVHYLKTN